MGDELLHSLPDAVLVADGERITSVNARAEAMLGMGRAALIGEPLATVLAPGELSRLAALAAQQDAGWAPPTTFRLRFRPPGAREVLSDVRLGRIGAALVVCARDISEERRGVELVSRLAEIVGRLAASAGAEALLDACEPIFIELGWTVAYSAMSGEITTPLRVLGREDDPIATYGRSIIGRHLEPAQSPIAAEVARTMRPIFLDNLPTLGEQFRAATTLDASMREAQVRRSAWCPIFSDGRLSHVLAVAGPDITEHDFVALQLFAAQLGAAMRAAALHAELVQRERLAAMGRMSAVLAHEVRTPIAVVFNALGALKHLEPTPDQTELLRIIGEEAQRLRSVAEEVLDFAKPGEPQMVVIDLLTLVGEASSAAMQHPAVPARAAEPTIRMDADGRSVRADAELLRGALVNLIQNALSHVSAGGAVRIEAAPTGEEVRLTVYNDGPTIAPEAASQLFEPFFTTRTQGIGLGLFVVRRSVETCGGRVELDATETGTQFSVYLKAAKEGSR